VVPKLKTSCTRSATSRLDHLVDSK